MKKKLLKLLEQKNAKKTDIVTRADKTDDVAELRTLNTEIDGLNDEIRSLQEMLDAIPEEDVTERTAVVNSNIPGVVSAGAETRTADTEGMEYREAFMHYVASGTPIPAELRDDAITTTTDAGAAIPTLVANQIIEKLESVGNILPLVTRTSFTAGMNIPTSSLKPVATWVAEGAGSDKQKKTASAIVFTHHKLRCEVAMTMEAKLMTVPAFETAFVNNVTEAMVKKIEESIIKGAKVSGAWVSPAGILSETVVLGQSVEIAAAADLSYATLTDAEGKLPNAYDNGAKWFMTKSTFMKFMGITDTTGQPVARVNYGLASRPERYLLGREVILNDYMDSYEASPASDKTVAFLFNPADYVLNTNYDMGIQRKQDWDTEDYLIKAVMAVDGKVIDKNSLVTITKKA